VETKTVKRFGFLASCVCDCLAAAEESDCTKTDLGGTISSPNSDEGVLHKKANLRYLLCRLPNFRQFMVPVAEKPGQVKGVMSGVGRFFTSTAC